MPLHLCCDNRFLSRAGASHNRTSLAVFFDNPVCCLRFDSMDMCSFTIGGSRENRSNKLISFISWDKGLMSHVVVSILLKTTKCVCFACGGGVSLFLVITSKPSSDSNE